MNDNNKPGESIHHLSFTTHNSLVPRLRFPEFQDTGGWDNCNLGDISTVVRGGSPRPIDGFITKDNSGLNWLKIGDVNKDDKYVTKTQEKVRVEALSKTREVHPDDLILSNSMSFGRPYLMKIKSCIHDGWIAITEIEESVEREYLYYLIFSPASQSYFLDNAAGSGVLNLNAEIIKSLPIAFPAQTEQQKIADCLSSLDALIAAQADKINALKTRKKGLMQQLFPREGETAPRLRFPEFRDAGEWTSEKLIKYFPRIRNGFVGTASPYYVRDGVPYLQGKNIKQGRIDDTGLVRISHEFHKNQAKSQLREGDILMVQSGHVGECAVVGQDFKNGNCHALIVLTPLEGTSSYFFKHYFYAPPGQALIAKVTTGNTIAHILATDLRVMNVKVPKLPEQQKIADCLSSLDALIAAHTEKLDALKTHKKGLMQQLFPNGEL